MDLDRIPLWSDRRDITVEALWKAYCQFPYLPRLASFDVLAKAISDGVSKLAWQSETFAYAEGHDGNRWVGLDVAQHIDRRDRVASSSIQKSRRPRSLPTPNPSKPLQRQDRQTLVRAQAVVSRMEVA